MSVIQRSTSVAANTVVDNLLAGSAFEYLNSRSIISMGVTTDATGIVFTIQIGSTVVVEESPAEVKASEFPSIPDEMYYNAAGVQGDRVVIRARNTTAGAIQTRVLVQITPV